MAVSILVLGMLFVFLMPPFAVMDEIRYFQRSYGISEGQHVCTLQEGTAGLSLPIDIARADQILGTKGIQTSVKQPFVTALTALPQDMAAQREFVQVNFCTYAWWASAPSALGIAVTRLFTSDLVTLFYAGRLSALFVGVFLLWAALRWIPYGKPLLYTVFLLPTVLHQMASYSVDAIQYPLVALYFALTMRFAARQHGHIAWKEGTLLLLLSLAAVHAKPGYLPLMLLVFLLPRHLFRTGAQYMGWLLLWVTTHGALTLLTAFSFLSGKTSGASLGDIAPGAQVSFVANQPFAFLGAATTTFVHNADLYLRQALGTFGWLETDLPVLAMMLLLVVLIGVVFSQARKIRLAPWQRVVLLVTVLIGALALMLSLYVISTPVGAGTVELMQGKYFLPYLPLVLFALAALPSRRLLTGMLLCMVVGVGIVSATTLSHRFYDQEFQALSGSGTKVTTKQTGSNTLLRQTVIAKGGELTGISLRAAEQPVDTLSNHRLILRDGTCTTVLYQGTLRKEQMRAGGSFMIPITPPLRVGRQARLCIEVYPIYQRGEEPLRMYQDTENSFVQGFLFSE